MFGKIIMLLVLAELFADTLDGLHKEFQETVRESFEEKEEE